MVVDLGRLDVASVMEGFPPAAQGNTAGLGARTMPALAGTVGDGVLVVTVGVVAVQSEMRKLEGAEWVVQQDLRPKRLA